MFGAALTGCTSVKQVDNTSTATISPISTNNNTGAPTATVAPASTSTLAPGVTAAPQVATNVPTVATQAPRITGTSIGNNPYTPPSATLSGTITFSGSTSVYPYAAALAEAFKQKYPKVQINITNVTGSDSGKADCLAGRVSFGMYSAAISDATLNTYQIALDGVALVVNPANPLSDITIDQLERVYNSNAAITGIGSARITNWSDLAPSYNNPLVAVSRENGSGTRTCFQDVIKNYIFSLGTLSNGKLALASGYDTQSGTQIAASTDQVFTNVSTNPNAIGYMSLGSVKAGVKKLTFAGVEANETNILNGTYKFQRPFLLMTKAGKKLSAAEDAFLKFALSNEGQAIAKSSNFIALDDATINAQIAKIPQ